ncbi:MAG: TetR/AcrR family transcriptional regulator [Proteobacteria bacterium]|nr:TetR/AcrR family transcriptional regulator [Pseudomonadota bacterium]
MPRPRWDRLDSARREQILGAAMAAFSTKGFDGASYNQIIAAAGVSKGAMYYYFDDKLDLFVTLLRHELEPLVELFHAFDTSDFWASFHQGSAAATRWAIERPEQIVLGRDLALLHDRNPGHPAIRALYDELLGFTDHLLAIGRELGEIRTDLPEGLLAAVVRACSEAVDRWYLDHFDPDADPDQVAGVFTDLIRRLAAPTECP